FAGSARYTQKFLATLRNAADKTEFKIWLSQLGKQTVALPLWDDGCKITGAINPGTSTIALDQHPVRSGAEWIILAADNSTYEIVSSDTFPTSTSIHLTTATANSWPAGTMMFPLMFGRLVNQMDLKLEATTPSRATFTIEIKENSPFARRLNPYPVATGTVGAQIPNLSTLPLWPIQAIYSRLLEHTEIDAVFESIGFTRQDAVRDFGRPVARGFEMEFYCSNRDQIAQV